MRYLGRISYPIYLWHVLALGLAARVVSSLPARVVLGSLIVVVVASGSYYLIEKPFLRLRTQRAPIVPPLRKQPV
jgi:peptidoglycan/LPS O-acetylase OafA/YrhL